MKALPARSVDCFICDLPYGQLAGGYDRPGDSENKKRKLANQTALNCAWDVKLNLEQFWEQVKRLCKDEHTPVLMFCNTKFGYELIKSNEDWFRYDLVWNKERGVSFLLANKMPMKSHEMIYVFSKKGAYYKRIDVKTDKGEYTKADNPNTIKSRQYGIKCGITEKRTLGKDGMRCPLSVLDFKSKSNLIFHPTEKPLELYKWLLERYCPEKGTILDPTAGSFNAVYAGAELGLHAIGIEKDIGFFNQAIKKTMENTKKKEIVKDTMESINPTNEIIM
jgi:site-specific DNA-methyltransferase (adenine-specific)